MLSFQGCLSTKAWNFSANPSTGGVLHRLFSAWSSDSGFQHPEIEAHGRPDYSSYYYRLWLSQEKYRRVEWGRFSLACNEMKIAIQVFLAIDGFKTVLWDLRSLFVIINMMILSLFWPALLTLELSAASGLPQIRSVQTMAEPLHV